MSRGPTSSSLRRPWSRSASPRRRLGDPPGRAWSGIVPARLTGRRQGPPIHGSGERSAAGRRAAGRGSVGRQAGDLVRVESGGPRPSAGDASDVLGNGERLSASNRQEPLPAADSRHARGNGERIVARQSAILAELPGSCHAAARAPAGGSVGNPPSTKVRPEQSDVGSLANAERNQREVNQLLTSRSEGVPMHVPRTAGRFGEQQGRQPGR